MERSPPRRGPESQTMPTCKNRRSETHTPEAADGPVSTPSHADDPLDGHVQGIALGPAHEGLPGARTADPIGFADTPTATGPLAWGFTATAQARSNSPEPHRGRRPDAPTCRPAGRPPMRANTHIRTLKRSETFLHAPKSDVVHRRQPQELPERAREEHARIRGLQAPPADAHSAPESTLTRERPRPPVHTSLLWTTRPAAATPHSPAPANGCLRDLRTQAPEGSRLPDPPSAPVPGGQPGPGGAFQDPQNPLRAREPLPHRHSRTADNAHYVK